MFDFKITTEWRQVSNGRVAPLTIVSIRHPNPKMLEIFSEMWGRHTSSHQDEHGIVHIISGVVDEEWVENVLHELHDTEESIKRHLRMLKVSLDVLTEVTDGELG